MGAGIPLLSYSQIAEKLRCDIINESGVYFSWRIAALQ